MQQASAIMPTEDPDLSAPAYASLWRGGGGRPHGRVQCRAVGGSTAWQRGGHGRTPGFGRGAGDGVHDRGRGWARPGREVSWQEGGGWAKLLRERGGLAGGARPVFKSRGGGHPATTPKNWNRERGKTARGLKKLEVHSLLG